MDELNLMISISCNLIVLLFLMSILKELKNLK